ncbi:MAG: hypothetical protein ACK478_06295 [Flavobacteriales bacterium]
MGKVECLALTDHVVDHPETYLQLIGFVSKGSDAQAMKASWVMAHVRKRDAAFSLNNQSQLIDLLQKARVGGVQRELLKCLEGLHLEEANQEVLLNFAWTGLTNMEYDFAVRYLCLRVLRFYAKRHKELLQELKTIEAIQLEKFGRFP